MEITVNLKEVAEFAAKFGDRAAQVAAEEITKAMDVSVLALDQSIRPRIPEGATGNLRGSGSIQFRGNPRSVYSGEFVITAPYGLPVERGRKPGRWPPQAPIELWVIRKLGLTGKEAKQAAFLIARAIGTRGTKPGQQFVAQGFDAVESRIIAIWDRLPDKIVLRWRSL